MITTIPARVFHRYLAPILGLKLKVHNRHGTYDEYVAKQKEKTLDPARIAVWQGEAWEEKLEGFRKLFERNAEFVEPATKCICLGARTGQEVVALKELGKDAIGIDLVEFPPHTVEGDIHDLAYDDGAFDFVFTNIFDHSAFPDKFVSEMERVCAPGGFIIVNVLIGNAGDDYSENIVYDAASVIALFKSSEVAASRAIENTFDSMNWEIVMRKN